MTNQKTDVNWEQIEADYRAGIKSLRQIAQAFGVGESTIRKYAKKYGWTRDLNPKIHAKADVIVRTEVVRSSVRTVSAITEKTNHRCKCRPGCIGAYFTAKIFNVQDPWAISYLMS